MLREERKKELLSRISEAKYITVEALSRQMYISPSTIRRNLAELEKAGYVKRSHGGVELWDASEHAPLRLRVHKNHAAKRMIAKQAAEKIEDNSIIFLDGSSTCLYMIPYLRRHKDITVYTNGVEACSMLAEANISAHCLGGQLLPRSLAFAGETAVSIARNLYFDVLFLSCGGLDNGVVTDYSQSEACLRRVLLEQSKKKYLLCDSSKIGMVYNYIICREEELTDIITDTAAE